MKEYSLERYRYGCEIAINIVIAFLILNLKYVRIFSDDFPKHRSYEEKKIYFCRQSQLLALINVTH